MGATEVERPARHRRRLLASLKEPEPPKGLRDAGRLLEMAQGAVGHEARRGAASAPCQEVVVEGAEVDLATLPIQTCWPGDAGPLITWGLVVTRGPQAAEPRRARTSASTASR